jgi:hypothetical protein
MSSGRRWQIFLARRAAPGQVCSFVHPAGVCVAPAKRLFPAEGGETRRPVYLVSHGWHTGS